MTEEQLKAFTPTERKILAVLSDGERHLRADICDALEMVVENGNDNLLSVHVFSIRAKLRPLGRWIVSESEARRSYYRLVTLVKPLMPIH